MAAVAQERVPAPISFNRDIRPILSNNCFACHGPDEKQRETKFHFDTREGAFLEPGIIVPGDPAKSVLVQRITHPDLPRPYRAWGYPVTPVIFLLVTGFMMYYLLTERPLQSLLGLLIMLSGLLIYAVFRKRADQVAVAASSGPE